MKFESDNSENDNLARFTRSFKDSSEESRKRRNQRAKVAKRMRNEEQAFDLCECEQ